MIEIRVATREDLPAIVGLLADDDLGSTREDPRIPLHQGYVAAFDAISSDENQLLIVADDGRAVVGCLQITFIPGLSRMGQWRALFESVRVARARRGVGIGRTMLEWAIAECRARGCGFAQLTTDKSRTRAHAFYARLGFEASHEGMKLKL
ncbi:GNAT family N-acetyltransferase [Pleomorphomonas oryzae]|uniref:GNAT family N-acetyltransferase n=1 Tax=Pleomorphomonas oryzae TaxID=261934 RepID=UPI000408E550|nr:GNAT family N-acetyltransferase [Pleomorphomonas oryzae]